MIDFGIQRATFNSTIQGSAPYLKKKAFSHERYNWKEVNESISRHDAASDNFKLMRGGIIPKKEYLESYREVGTIKYRAQKSALYSLLQQGASLVLNKLDGTPSFEKLRAEISRFSGCQTVVSGYAAFGNDTSFGNHWDTHDVFALQLIGRKRWTIFKPTVVNPIFTQSSVGREHECADEPFMDIILEAGDLLYLPRGWWHTVSPAGSPTFHLAIGIYPPYIIDYITWLLGEHIQKCPSAGARMERTSTTLEPLSNLVQSLTREIFSDENQRRFIETFNASERLSSPYEIENFGQPTNPSIRMDAILKVNTFHITPDLDDHIIVNGTKLNLDKDAKLLIQLIIDLDSASVRQLCELLPGISGSKVLALATELIKEDILTYSYPTEPE